MTINVLIVDDSTFICKKIKEILEQPLEGTDNQVFKVVGMAGNGMEAVRLAAALKPDVITMDVEMPVMDGIAAVRRIMKETPTPILMFSAMTHVGARATLDALDAGALDFLPKQLNDIDADREIAKRLLRRRVRMIALEAEKIKTWHRRRNHGPNQESILSASGYPLGKSGLTVHPGSLRLIAIAASTGGPVAVQKVLSGIPRNCPVPIIIVQHMPQNFTRSFAERLNQQCSIRAKEAQDGDVIEPGLILVAPGGMQMEIKSSGGVKRVVLRSKTAQELYSPCADITLTSVAQYFPGTALAVVLTGMGADGREGAIQMKRTGATVWAQNEATCTIYGMPKAIVEAGLADRIYSLDEIADEFARIN